MLQVVDQSMSEEEELNDELEEDQQELDHQFEEQKQLEDQDMTNDGGHEQLGETEAETDHQVHSANIFNVA
jgi:hypothetical protein